MILTIVNQCTSWKNGCHQLNIAWNHNSTIEEEKQRTKVLIFLWNIFMSQLLHSCIFQDEKTCK